MDLFSPPPRPAFVHGVNYPWSTDGRSIFYALDFGTNVWGSHLGVSTRRSAIARDYARMADLGFVVARWFVLGDGRCGIVYDELGLPAGLDASFFPDLDAGLEIAQSVGMQVVLVMLDHRWMFEGVRDTLADPATGMLFETRLPQGRARVLQTGAGRSALCERVLEPIVRRYGPHGARSDLASAICAYELMNEPDFIVQEWERDLSAHVAWPLEFERLADLVSRFSAIVHAHSTARTTIGCARLHNLWVWEDPALGIDLLQIHSYPDLKHRHRDADLFGTPAARLSAARPLVLGEFPADGPARHPAHASPPPTTLGDYLAFAVEGGYAGAWAWSFSGTDAYGPVPEAPLRAFAARHPDLVNRRAFNTATATKIDEHEGDEDS